jgi:hypothetical protein
MIVHFITTAVRTSDPTHALYYFSVFVAGDRNPATFRRDTFTRAEEYADESLYWHAVTSPKESSYVQLELDSSIRLHLPVDSYWWYFCRWRLVHRGLVVACWYARISPRTYSVIHRHSAMWQDLPSHCFTIYGKHCSHVNKGRNQINFISMTLGARGSVVGWGTMLQAGRSRVQFPMRSCIDLILPAAIWPCGLLSL